MSECNTMCRSVTRKRSNKLFILPDHVTFEVLKMKGTGMIPCIVHTKGIASSF